MLLVTLAVAASVVAPVAATAAADDKTILLIYADARLIPAIVTADQAIRDAKRASEVVRHLRALFRKEHVDQQPLDINDVIREITRLLGKDLERKRLSLRLRLADDLPRVLGDVVQFQQVILNVVVNACEAMADDDPRDVSIETTRLDPGALEITVEDTGRGVEESELERIFDRFITSKAGGLGMGLSISRSIIQAHGGRIWATRNKDRGLTMHIEIPCPGT